MENSIVFTSHIVQLLLTSHVVQLLLTSHVVQLLLTSHVVQLLIPSHVIQLLFMSHVVQLLLTSHVVQLLLTFRVVQLLLTSHVVQLLLTFHAVQLLLTSRVLLNLVYLKGVAFLPLTLIFKSTYLFKPLIFHELWILWDKRSSLKYQKFTPSGCNDKGIRKFELVAKTQFLTLSFIKYLTPISVDSCWQDGIH